MKYLIDSSSRFRILKGGKISLVIGGLLLGHSAYATNYTGTTLTVDDTNTTAANTTNYAGLKDVTITSTGNLNISATGANAESVYFDTNLGANNIITNDGSITATSDKASRGIYVILHKGNINTGVNSSITVESSSNTNQERAIGIAIDNSDSDGNITALGTISAKQTGNQAAWGIATNHYSGIIQNSGTIQTTSNEWSIGITTTNLLTQSTRISNNGTINSTTTGAGSIGMQVAGTNSGTLENNSGASITSTNTSSGDAYGLKNTTNSGTITNNGSITSTSNGTSYGIHTTTNNGNINTGSSSSINSTSDGANVAYGIYVNSGNGDITTAGTMTITQSGTAAARAINHEGTLDGTMNNSGTINATATSTGASSWAVGMKAVNLGANGDMINSGNINVTSTNLSAYGLEVLTNNSGDISNTGNIDVTGSTNAYGINSNANTSGAATVTNSGSIRADINNILDFEAYSIYVSGSAGHTVTNQSTGKLYGNVNASDTTFINQGLVELPWNANTNNTAANISTFTNQSSGTFSINLDNSGAKENSVTNNYSQLTSTTATISDNSTINVKLSNTGSRAIVGQRLTDVINATTLNIDTTKVNITDNSMVLDFNIIDDANSIQDNTLDLQVSTSNTAQTSGIQANGHQKSMGETSVQIYNLMHNIVELRQRQDNYISGLNSGDDINKEKNIWLKPYYSKGSQKNADGFDGYEYSTVGLGIGYDNEINKDSKLGVALFYTLADLNMNNNSGDGDIENYTAMVYGSTPIDLGIFNSFLYQGAYGIQSNKNSRNVIDGLNTYLFTSDYQSNFYGIDFKLMGEYNLSDKMKAKPVISTGYRKFDSPSYQSASNDTTDILNVKSSIANQVILKAGNIFEYKLNDKSNFITDVRLGYDFMHGKNKVSSSYALVGDVYTSKGIDNGGFLYSLGLTYETKTLEDSSMNFNYNLEGEGKDFQNHVVSLTYTHKF